MHNISLEFTITKEQLISMLKDLLCVPHSWVYNTIQLKVKLHLPEEDKTEIQREIYEWLSIKPRKDGFMKEE